CWRPRPYNFQMWPWPSILNLRCPASPTQTGTNSKRRWAAVTDISRQSRSSLRARSGQVRSVAQLSLLLPHLWGKVGEGATLMHDMRRQDAPLLTPLGSAAAQGGGEHTGRAARFVCSAKHALAGSDPPDIRTDGGSAPETSPDCSHLCWTRLHRRCHF